MNTSNFTLHGHHASGNVYKVALFFALAGQADAYKHVDIFNAGTKSETYTAFNVFQEVPVLVHGDDVVTQSDVNQWTYADPKQRVDIWGPKAS